MAKVNKNNTVKYGKGSLTSGAVNEHLQEIITTGYVDATNGAYPKPLTSDRMPRNAGIVRAIWTNLAGNEKGVDWGEAIIAVNSTGSKIMSQKVGTNNPISLSVASDGRTLQFYNGTGYWMRIAYIFISSK